MQNKCGSCNQGFVPVNGNWNFNMEGDCPQRRRRNMSADNDCQCERCNESRSQAGGCAAERCEQNTCIRNADNHRCGYTVKTCSHSGCGCDECIRSANDHSNDDDKSCTCETQEDYTRTQCGCDNADTRIRSCRNRGVGMINGVMQEIGDIYQSGNALRAGTLFPELHKPLSGYCPYEANCGTRAQAAAFGAWEMRLYLNTHPKDEEAMKLFRKLCKEAEKENYATAFLTDECCTNGWNWVKNPWPWEYSCNCGD